MAGRVALQNIYAPDVSCSKVITTSPLVSSMVSFSMPVRHAQYGSIPGAAVKPWPGNYVIPTQNGGINEIRMDRTRRFDRRVSVRGLKWKIGGMCCTRSILVKDF